MRQWDSGSLEETPRSGQEGLSGTSGRSFPSGKGTDRIRDHECRSGRAGEGVDEQTSPLFSRKYPPELRPGRSVCPPPLPFPGCRTPFAAQRLCPSALLPLEAPAPPPRFRSCSPPARLLLRAAKQRPGGQGGWWRMDHLSPARPKRCCSAVTPS